MSEWKLKELHFVTIMETPGGNVMSGHRVVELNSPLNAVAESAGFQVATLCDQIAEQNKHLENDPKHEAPAEIVLNVPESEPVASNPHAV